MSDVGKGAVISGPLVFIFIMIMCCCCCCCKSNPSNNQGVTVVQPAAAGPSIMATRTNVVFPMQPLAQTTSHTSAFAQTNGPILIY